MRNRLLGFTLGGLSGCAMVRVSYESSTESRIEKNRQGLSSSVPREREETIRLR
jgi:hypothetical protein